MKPYVLVALQRLQAEGNWPGGQHRLSAGILDAIAERKIRAGWTAKRNPVCPGCHLRKSNNGSCYCTDGTK